MTHRTGQAEVVEKVQHSGNLHTDDEKNKEDPVFPEGGWQAWMTIGGAYVGHAYLLTSSL